MEARRDASIGMIAAFEAGRKRRHAGKQSNGGRGGGGGPRGGAPHPFERRDKVVQTRKKRLAGLLVAETLAAQEKFEEANTSMLKAFPEVPLSSPSPVPSSSSQLRRTKSSGDNGGGGGGGLSPVTSSAHGHAITSNRHSRNNINIVGGSPIVSASWVAWQEEQKQTQNQRPFHQFPPPSSAPLPTASTILIDNDDDVGTVASPQLLAVPPSSSSSSSLMAEVTAQQANDNNAVTADTEEEDENGDRGGKRGQEVDDDDTSNVCGCRGSSSKVRGVCVSSDRLGGGGEPTQIEEQQGEVGGRRSSSSHNQLNLDADLDGGGDGNPAIIVRRSKDDDEGEDDDQVERRRRRRAWQESEEEEQKKQAAAAFKQKYSTVTSTMAAARAITIAAAASVPSSSNGQQQQQHQEQHHQHRREWGLRRKIPSPSASASASSSASSPHQKSSRKGGGKNKNKNNPPPRLGPGAVAAVAAVIERKKKHETEVEAAGKAALQVFLKHHDHHSHQADSHLVAAPAPSPAACYYSLSASQKIEDALLDTWYHLKHSTMTTTTAKIHPNNNKNSSATAAAATPSLLSNDDDTAEMEAAAALSIGASEAAAKVLGIYFKDNTEKEAVEEKKGASGSNGDGDGACVNKEERQEVKVRLSPLLPPLSSSSSSSSLLPLTPSNVNDIKNDHHWDSFSSTTKTKKKKEKEKEKEMGGERDSNDGRSRSVMEDLRTAYQASQLRFTHFTDMRRALVTQKERAKEKCRCLVLNYANRSLLLALRQWREVVVLKRNVEVVEAYRKTRGARGVGQVLLRLLDRHYQACFLRWHDTACVMMRRDCERVASVILQRTVARGWLLGRRKLLKKGELAAAVEIQRRLCRGPLGRKRFESFMTHSSLATAVKCVQRIWRAVVLRRKWRKVSGQLKVASCATTIQAVARRRAMRGHLDLKRHQARQANAATKIQSKTRQLSSRKRCVQERKKQRVARYVTFVQAHVRGNSGRLFALAMKERQRAAVRIQKGWRVGIPGRRQRRKRQMRAATVINTRVRMKLARELANKKRRWKKGWKEPTEESKQLSAHVITNAIRIRVAKLTVVKKKQEVVLKKNKSATRIGGVYRQKKAKEVVKLKKQAKASSQIQRRARVKIAKKKVRKLRTKKKAAAALWMAYHLKFSARNARRVVAHRNFVKLVAKNNRQATKIQGAYRGLQGRRVGRSLKAAHDAKVLEEIRNKAATAIQVKTRSNQRRAVTAAKAAAARKKRQEEEEVGAVAMQQCWRRFSAKKALAALQLSKRQRLAGNLLTRVGRGQQGRATAKDLRRKRDEAIRVENMRQDAATYIQAWKRATFSRRITKVMLSVYLAQKEAVRLKKRFDSATTIQCMARSRVARSRRRARMAVRRKLLEELLLNQKLELELDSLHTKLEESLFAIRLQCFARKKAAVGKATATRIAREKEREALIFKKRHNAAAAIQSLARARVSRKWFKKNRPILLRAKNSKRSKRDERGSRHQQQEKVALRRQGSSIQGGQRNQAALLEGGKRGGGNSSSLVKASNKGGGGGGVVKWSKDADDGGSANGFKKLYDDSAKAHYWYNEETQEAQWTNPTDN